MGRKPEENVVYMLVSEDKYEIPIVVADTVAELAKACRVSESTIRSCARRQKQGMKSRYVKVDISEV